MVEVIEIKAIELEQDFQTSEWKREEFRQRIVQRMSLFELAVEERVTEQQLKYNIKISSARVVVENAFGRLKGR